MGIYSTDVTTYPQTQAQWDADSRILPPNVVAVVTDGANIGRKKWFDDVHTFAELDYTDAAGPGGATDFTDLDDVPSSYTGQAGKVATVKTDETGLEFTASGSFGIPMTYSNATAGAPAEGVFRFDSTTAGSIANVFINMTAPTGVDNAGQWTLNNPQRGYLKATHAGGDTLFKFNGEGANNGGVYEAPMVHLSGPLPANNAACRVVYLPGPAASGTLVFPWRVWGTDETFGAPVMPTTLADHYAAGPYAVNMNTATDSGLLLFAQMPDDYEGQAIQVRICGNCNVGNEGTAILYANAAIINPGSALIASADSETLNTSTLSLAGANDDDLYSKTFSVTPSGGGWAPGSVLALLIGREGTNVGDTLDEAVRFTCAIISY